MYSSLVYMCIQVTLPVDEAVDVVFEYHINLVLHFLLLSESSKFKGEPNLTINSKRNTVGPPNSNPLKSEPPCINQHFNECFIVQITPLKCGHPRIAIKSHNL